MYQKSTLPNGIRVVTEAIPYVKSVTVGVWVGTGARNEEDHNHGISHFIEHLMFKGTANRSAKDIAESVDAVGGQLNAFTAKEYTCYYIKVLDNHLELALDILSDMILSSRYAQEDIAREREVVLEEVHMYEDSPDELVHDFYLDNVWPHHPLGRNILGSTEAIGRFDRNLVCEYYDNFYRPDNIVIAAAGNLTHAGVEELVGRFFGGFAGRKKTQAARPPLYKPTRRLHARDSEQVHFCLGTASVPQDSPDIYVAHVLNNILGGGISSRLFQAIREERGLAYSIYSYLSNYSDCGLFTIYAGTRPANLDQVIELVLENVEQLKNGDIGATELTKTKEQLKGNLLLGLESSSSRMSRLGKMEITMGKYTTLDEVVAKIEKVSIGDLRKMMDDIFVADKLSFTALGPVKNNALPKGLQA
ncbi:M16 family metallopeptidase [Anaeroselena agilis]|uniref:Pitrilysin family protein n=1 Tax=Anaeroselena agilis TaxID=3063788 RepID=A0ABU3NX09_9FIRM|nr:pitrilysin family protein [Selenomonadales bacterium 4137-cl]